MFKTELDQKPDSNSGHWCIYLQSLFNPPCLIAYALIAKKLWHSRIKYFTGNCSVVQMPLSLELNPRFYVRKQVLRSWFFVYWYPICRALKCVWMDPVGNNSSVAEISRLYFPVQGLLVRPRRGRRLACCSCSLILCVVLACEPSLETIKKGDAAL